MAIEFARSVGAKPGYILELQGLRTVAALLVAIYHIFFQRISGGVDVFFVVAAYFMTKTFLKVEFVTVGRVVEYYSSTFRRIIPSQIVVIVFTILVAVVVIPETLWRFEVKNAFSSIFFVENWRLFKYATDYLASNVETSPFQQMWALSLQVQMFILFPLLFLGGAALARLSRVSNRLWIVWILAAVLVMSFAYSVHFTAIDQPRAYFDTRARLWEFALGGLLAVFASRVRMSAKVSGVIGNVALCVLIAFAAIIDVSRSFPGYGALVPVLCAAMIIISAQNHGRIPLLSWSPVVRFGDYSFAFYLWHWPILRFYKTLYQVDDVGISVGMGIIVASGVLAYASTILFERPFRRVEWLARRKIAALAACGIAAMPAISASAAWEFHRRNEIAEANAMLSEVRFGAKPEPKAVYPALIIAKDDRSPNFNDSCFQAIKESAVITCEFGQKRGDRTVVIVGSSHAAQWFPAIESLSEKYGFRILNMTKMACQFSTSPVEQRQEDPSCIDWNEEVMDRILDIRPNMVLVLGTVGNSTGDNLPDGFVDAWKTLRSAEIPILAIRDNPRMAKDVAYCLGLNQDNPNVCGSAQPPGYDQSVSIGELGDGFAFVDFTAEFCQRGFCPPLAGMMLKYYDNNHLTATYARTFAPRLEPIVSSLLEYRLHVKDGVAVR